MVEDRAANGASEPVTMVTGGSKPLHRFLKGQPKSIGVRHTTLSLQMKNTNQAQINKPNSNKIYY